MDELYGLIFDVDGVIADTEPPTAAATKKMFADFFATEDVQTADFEAGLGRGAEAYILAAARIHELEFSDKQLIRAVAAREENFIELMQEFPLEAFPGVLTLMDKALAKPNFKLAIATSSSREMSEEVLKAASVPYDRMTYVSGSDVTRKKPDPQIFLLAAERMGITPSMCAVIEDTPGGVEAAKAAGTWCIAVTNTATPEILKQADMICNSLEDVDIETITNLIENANAS